MVNPPPAGIYEDPEGTGEAGRGEQVRGQVQHHQLRERAQHAGRDHRQSGRKFAYKIMTGIDRLCK